MSESSQSRPHTDGNGKPTDLQHGDAIHDWKYQDPYAGQPSRKGMLLSDEIHEFCTRGLLVSKGYKPKNLRPASYTMTIGAEFVDSAGKRGELDDEQPYFYMEPNSIVYVSPAEELDLPYYIVARFNLRVKWVYKGVLLGTGPQVEPGFKGRLSCPLFNLTNQKIKIRLGDEFATIDFERTADFCRDLSAAQIKEKIKQGQELDTVEGMPNLLLFKQGAFPALKHLPDWEVLSSLVAMQNEVKTWRAIGIGIVISFFALALTLLSFQNNLYREILSFNRDNSTLTNKVSSLENEIRELKNATQLLAAGSPNSPKTAGPQQIKMKP
jgi:deoxycytidine triphosphate deaminase